MFSRAGQGRRAIRLSGCFHTLPEAAAPEPSGIGGRANPNEMNRPERVRPAEIVSFGSSLGLMTEHDLVRGPLTPMGLVVITPMAGIDALYGREYPGHRPTSHQLCHRFRFPRRYGTTGGGSSAQRPRLESTRLTAAPGHAAVREWCAGLCVVLPTGHPGFTAFLHLKSHTSHLQLRDTSRHESCVHTNQIPKCLGQQLSRQE